MSRGRLKIREKSDNRRWEGEEKCNRKWIWKSNEFDLTKRLKMAKTIFGIALCVAQWHDGKTEARMSCTYDGKTRFHFGSERFSLTLSMHHFLKGSRNVYYRQSPHLHCKLLCVEFFLVLTVHVNQVRFKSCFLNSHEYLVS